MKLQQEVHWHSREDFRALEQLIKGSGTQAVPSSILPVTANDEGRNRKSQQINSWLQAWYHWQNFGFFGTG